MQSPFYSSIYMSDKNQIRLAEDMLQAKGFLEADLKKQEAIVKETGMQLTNEMETKKRVSDDLDLHKMRRLNDKLKSLKKDLKTCRSKSHIKGEINSTEMEIADLKRRQPRLVDHGGCLMDWAKLDLMHQECNDKCNSYLKKYNEECFKKNKLQAELKNLERLCEQKGGFDHYLLDQEMLNELLEEVIGWLMEVNTPAFTHLLESRGLSVMPMALAGGLFQAM
ncbi:hypothetical protein BVC80_543g1 [Macleaya cordata]|uniref:Uncharacterized protein n=1 Tax=Macleaya cordata TaxID=56857 RepID=A0A200QXZ0_MACCD|nr:hypothetical protein BVC80_543g1 [Macleaya cordata]